MSADPATRALIEAAARAGGDWLRTRFGASEIVSRAARDIKLGEDAAAQARIAAVLAAGSSLPILAEEGGWLGPPARGDAPYWAVDPLDGSYNFATGVPLCCVSIALCRGTRPIVGGVLDFLRDEYYCGGLDIGLSLNGVALAPPAPGDRLYATGMPSAGAHSSAALLAAGAPLAAFAKIRMIGSAALSLAWVAAGRFDAYAENGIRWWDVAAGLALVEGAGGAISARGADPLGPFDVRADRAADTIRLQPDMRKSA